MRLAARRAASTLLFCCLLSPPALGIIAPASAYAPTCRPRPADVAAPTEVPWAQERLGVRHLTTLADGGGVTVAVLDSGVDPTHPQLTGAIQAGGDLLDPGGDGKTDCVGHGTAVASLIAARPHDGVGFQGLAPKAAILAIRVSEQVELDGTTAGRTVGATGLATAVRRAVDLRATVLNLSLVLYRDDPAVRDAIAYAVAHDVVVVAAVGNRFEQGNDTPYPAAYDGVLGVGAIGADGRRLAGSQIGPWVDLVAPGGRIVTAALPRGRTVQEGTSFAAPFVAATAALVRQYHPELGARQVADRLTATADPSAGGPGSHEYGAGVLNPYRALADQVAGAGRSVSGGRAGQSGTASGGPSSRPTTPTTLAPPATARTGERGRALAIAGGCLTLAGIAVLAAVVVPRGRRRHWRPGPPPSPPA
jgi:membrane-anchored mycosin MYCP